MNTNKQIKSIGHLLGTSVLALLLAACGGGGGGATAPVVEPPVVVPPVVEPPNVEPPAFTLLSTSPAADSAEVGTTASFVAQFSTPLDASSVNPETVHLLGSAGRVAADLVADADTVRIVPRQALALLTRYEAQLTDGLKDSAGQSFAGTTSAFTTRDGLFSSASLLGNQSAGNATAPKIAVNAAGDAFAVWKQNSNPERILAQRYSAKAGVWEPAVAIDTAATGTANNPEVAVDAAGNAIAIWVDGPERQVVTNRFNASLAPAGAWGDAVVIEDFAFSPATPHVGMDAAGNAIAVWSQSGGSQQNIMANLYDIQNNKWGNVAQVVAADSQGRNGREPRVAVSGNGSAVALWRREDGARSFILSSSFSAGTWTTAQPIERPGAGGQSQNPDVVMNNGGVAVATWSAVDGAGISNIWASRYDTVTGWGVAALVEADDLGNAFGARPAIDATGNAVAVWLQSDGTRQNVMASRLSASTNAWGTATLLETNDLSDADLPAVATDAAGNAIAVWGQRVSGAATDSIFASRFTAATGVWKVPERIDNQNGQAAVPKIGVDGLGRATIVWTQSDGSKLNLVTNSFR
jgi:hypothetical protein